MKKRMVLLTLVLALACTACTKSATKKEASGGEMEEIMLMDLCEASKKAAADLEEAKKTCKKLHFEKIVPYCRDVDSVYDISVGINDYYKGIQDEKEMMEEQMKIMNFFHGNEPFDTECFETRYNCDAADNIYETFQEFYDDLQSGKKFEPSYLVYANHTEDKMRYIDVFATLVSLHWNMGVCYDAVREYRLKDEERKLCDMPEVVLPEGRQGYTAVYDVYHTDDNLDDSYPLMDGTISIRDAIASAEHYLNDVVPVEEDQDVRLVMERVYVYKISDSLYFFKYTVKRQIYGVNMQWMTPGTLEATTQFESDLSLAYQIEKDKIDICEGFHKVMNLKKEKEITDIMSLRDAIGILENGLGENSAYSVFGVELGYMFQCEDGNNGTGAGNGTVCWVFKTYNESDHHYVVFYVDVDSGEVTVVERSRY